MPMNIPFQITDTMKTRLLKTVLKSIYYSGTHKLMSADWQGAGLIYTMHRVNSQPVPAFAPNRILTITPQYLEDIITQVLDQGLDVVSLDEAYRRLKEGEFDRRFVCFTFDDGYRDNLTCAYPIFKKFNLPFAIYIPSDYPDGDGELWWVALEKVISKCHKISIEIEGKNRTFSCASIAEKWSTFNHMYWHLRGLDEEVLRAYIRKICHQHDIDMAAICRQSIMNWDEIRQLSDDPLVTLGAHNKGHYALAKLGATEARREISEGLSKLQSELGKKIEHYAYPYGDATSAGPRDFELASEFGFKTGVTTRKGVLFKEHVEHLMALPRVSLNGDYQSLKYNSVYLKGIPFALLNRFKRLNVD
ncbi:MAG: polysaccharide deacetylase family protein [bacterium]|nr:polysaccharide deacetylase family protein [bacterium]